MDSRQMVLKQIRKNNELMADRDGFLIDKEKIKGITKKIMILFFPEYYNHYDEGERLLDEITEDLNNEIKKIDVNYQEITDSFIQRLPEVQKVIYTDIQAIYDGDPSAKTFSEIVLSFPGFYASFMYRLAHELYELDVPIIPRIIAEFAHQETGIDINPGAKIGKYFCIDHGTGIVIGETATVGDHVRLYHGVTLGVRSFRKDNEGHLLKGGKRHPDVGNNVIIYANATVLGGDTLIEDNSVIPAGSLILQTPEKYK
ncbi:MAG: serine acetyltransferase [Erysipelotrichaceae bacterium]|nr:serine acetyltransferase [Erysipelotrichaceae bacterium]